MWTQLTDPPRALVQTQILGPREAQRSGQAVELGPPKHRLLLAVLICGRGQPATADRAHRRAAGAEPAAVGRGEPARSTPGDGRCILTRTRSAWLHPCSCRSTSSTWTGSLSLARKRHTLTNESSINPLPSLLTERRRDVPRPFLHRVHAHGRGQPRLISGSETAAAAGTYRRAAA